MHKKNTTEDHKNTLHRIEDTHIIQWQQNKIDDTDKHKEHQTSTRNNTNTMDTTLDLSNAHIQNYTALIQTFFQHNQWTCGHYHEDQIILDAMHADFLQMLASLATAINQVKDVRGALHIHLHNIEKANTPLPPLLTFHNSIIDQHHLFDGYNLYVFAHGDDSRSVNIGTLALSL